MVYYGTNLLSSQFSGHLNKVPVKIQSLSLLMGLVGDRQHEYWLFQFHFDECVPESALGIIKPFIHNEVQLFP